MKQTFEDTDIVAMKTEKGGLNCKKLQTSLEIFRGIDIIYLVLIGVLGQLHKNGDKNE